MVMPGTEQETPQSLEQVLKEGQASSEQEEASEEEPTEKEAEETTEPVEDKPDTPEAFESRVQAEADKRVNPYREKRETDTALIRSQATQIKELKSEQNAKVSNKLVDSILSGDVDEGISPDETKNRETALKELTKNHKEYKEKSAEVEETAQFVSDMTGKMPTNIVKEFGLDDSNPNVRAANGVKFLDETVSVFQHNQDFLMALEAFLPKGDELRKQIEELVDGMSDPELNLTTEKSKKLYLKDKMQGVKVTPRKKPPSPSDGSGGGSTPSSPADKVTKGLGILARK